MRAARFFLIIILFASRASAAGVRWDATKSFIAVKTGRTGKLSFLGHDHAVLATRWEARICLNPPRDRLLSAEVTIPTGSLVIDTPEARKAAGMDESNLSDITRNKIQKKMLGDGILNAQAFPLIAFKITGPVPIGGQSQAFAGKLTVHGQTRDQTIATKYSLKGQNVSASGKFKFLQSQFGIPREKVFGGTVEVADEVEVRFRLEGAIDSHRDCDSLDSGR